MNVLTEIEENMWELFFAPDFIHNLHGQLDIIAFFQSKKVYGNSMSFQNTQFSMKNQT